MCFPTSERESLTVSLVLLIFMLRSANCLFLGFLTDLLAVTFFDYEELL